MTLRECFAYSLELFGATLVCKNKRRWIYTFPGEQAWFYYLGASGSLRSGRHFTSSIPCSTGLRVMLLQKCPEYK